jgi:hypothetical protein
MQNLGRGWLASWLLGFLASSRRSAESAVSNSGFLLKDPEGSHQPTVRLTSGVMIVFNLVTLDRFSRVRTHQRNR